MVGGALEPILGGWGVAVVGGRGRGAGGGGMYENAEGEMCSARVCTCKEDRDDTVRFLAKGLTEGADRYASSQGKLMNRESRARQVNCG